MSLNPHPVGFDYLRIGLACSIVAYHSVTLQRGPDFYFVVLNSPFRPFATILLFLFFALSGFLVAGSLFRNKITTFLSLRALRIFPALAVEVILSALFLGPIFTSFDLHKYFFSGTFFRYLFNMVGYVHFQLPGVFLDNPYPKMVNEQLWTVPYELECYVAIAVLFVFGFVKRRLLLILACALYAAAKTTNSLLFVHDQSLFDGRALVMCFLVGASIYTFRDKISLSTKTFALMVILSLVFLSRTETFYLAAFTVGYCTVFIGLANFKRLSIMEMGDYSYGLYLFGYPIQQAIASFPVMRHWWINLPLALSLGLLYAAFSWNCVEKPIMKRKKKLVSWVDEFSEKVEKKYSNLPITIWANASLISLREDMSKSR